MKNKTCGLEIGCIYHLDNGDLLAYYTKGHHDKQEFLHALYQLTDIIEETIQTVTHRWARWQFQGDYKKLGLVCLKERRGVKGEFPVTYIDMSF